MTTAAAEFWSGESEYQELAEQFERNIERTHPDTVTSRGQCVCLDYTNYCGWAVTAVNYYEYRGESV